MAADRPSWRRTAPGRALGLLTAIWMASGLPGAAEAARATVDQPFALLRGLDKITGRTEQIAVRVGEAVAFGTLTIAVRACRDTPPEETPENAAFLEIRDQPPGYEPREAFVGWMFSSSPAVSAMDHPVFDVWVVDCVSELPRPPEDMGFDGERLPLPQAGIVPPGLPEARR